MYIILLADPEENPTSVDFCLKLLLANQGLVLISQAKLVEVVRGLFKVLQLP